MIFERSALRETNAHDTHIHSYAQPSLPLLPTQELGREPRKSVVAFASSSPPFDPAAASTAAGLQATILKLEQQLKEARAQVTHAPAATSPEEKKESIWIRFKARIDETNLPIETLFQK